MNYEKHTMKCEPQNYAAMNHRLKALILSWLSTSNWKHCDARLSDNEEDRRALMLEGNAYEVCADQLRRCTDDFNLSEKPIPHLLTEELVEALDCYLMAGNKESRRIASIKAKKIIFKATGFRHHTDRDQSPS